MDNYKELNVFTKAILGIGLILLIYGYLCRIIPVFYFWESKTIGWKLIFIGLIGVLYQGIRIRKERNKNPLINKIGIGFICFILLVQTILFVSFQYSDALKVAKNYIKKSDIIKEGLGDINGFTVIPMGGLHLNTNNNGKTGDATLNLIVKGEKAFEDVTVYLHKKADSDWEIHQFE